MSEKLSTAPRLPEPTPEVVRTFLFTDVEGSTRLWEQEPVRMRTAMARHDALGREAVHGAGGRIVKTTGDGLHAVFDDAAQAVQAALALQRAMAAPVDDDGIALKVRCGVHSGPSEARDGDYYGPVLNRAARVMSAAHGGQTLVTQAVAERVASRLPQDTTLLDLGTVRLRDLASPERVLQLVHPALRAQFPPLRSLEATPNNLVQQLNSFVGREREFREVRELLGRTRLLTLLGVGGIGKSRLSVQLGAELLDEYPDGVWLIELAPLADPRLVPQALATVLGVREDAGVSVMDALIAHVRDRTMLVILDNCEHVVHACAALAKRLLQSSSTLKLLTSSRDALQVAGETIYPLATLSVPALNEPWGGVSSSTSLEVLAKHESVRLFVDRASAVQPAFRLDASNAQAVAEICRRLDGIALALELAAARTRALSVQTIAERLSDRFRLLVTGDRTVLPRQRTLRALIDWSFELLDEAERRLFRRLAVFAGGFSLEAAEAVCTDESLNSSDIMDLLARLVEKSLVVMDVSGGRYRLLETVRAYAEEKLAEAGDADGSRRRHASHFIELAETARPHLAGPEQGEWLARLDSERENLLAAQHGLAQVPEAAHEALRLLHALRPYWISRGELTMALEMALDVLGQPALAPRDESRCMALFNAGQLGFVAGRYDEAQEHLEECLAVARERGTSAIMARVLQPLGMTCLARRDYDAAARHLHDAVLGAEQMGDQREIAAALNALAMLHRVQGRFEEALPICERAVRLVRELGDQENIGIGLISLGMVTVQLGRLDEARTILAEASEIGASTGSQPIQLGAIELRCGLEAASGAWTESARRYGTAQEYRRRSGLRRDAADDSFVGHAVKRSRAALGEAQFLEAQELGALSPPTTS